MRMLGFNEPTDQLALSNRIIQCDHLLIREDDHVLRRA